MVTRIFYSVANNSESGAANLRRDSTTHIFGLLLPSTTGHGKIRSMGLLLKIEGAALAASWATIAIMFSSYLSTLY